MLCYEQTDLQLTIGTRLSDEHVSLYLYNIELGCSSHVRTNCGNIFTSQRSKIAAKHCKECYYEENQILFVTINWFYSPNMVLLI